MCVCYIERFRISSSLFWNSTIMILSIKFETRLKMYAEIQEILVQVYISGISISQEYFNKSIIRYTRSSLNIQQDCL